MLAYNTQISKLIVCLIFFVNFGQILAQKEAKFTHLTRKNGLSHNNVYVVFQDKYGFLWFGTHNGLDRYDGYRLKQFRHQIYDDNSIASNSISDIVEDNYGNLWLGTNGGLDCYNPVTEKFKHFSNGDDTSACQLNMNEISSVAIDSKGNIWIATIGGGLNKIDSTLKSCQHFTHDIYDASSIESNDVYKILVDDEDNLWIGTSNSLDYLDVETNSFTHFVIGHEGFDESMHLMIQALMLDKQEILWIGTSNGLFTLDIELGLFTTYQYDVVNSNSIPDNSINALVEDSNGDIWIGTDNGVSNFSKETRKFTNYYCEPNNPLSISNNRVISLFEDRSKVLWIGTDGGGINKLDLKRKPFYNWNIANNKSRALLNPNITAIEKDDDGNIFFGTNGSGIAIGKTNNKNHESFDLELLKSNKYIPDDQIRSLCYANGKLWVGMHTGGLSAISKKNGTYSVKNYKNTGDSTGISNNQVNIVMKGRDGCLWIGTRNGLDKMICGAKTANEYFISYKHSFSQKNSIADNYVTSLLEDRYGNIWVGTYDKGIDKINIKTQKITHFENIPNDNESLISNRVNSMMEDHDGNIWVATVDKGLDMFDPKTNNFIHYSTHNGVESDEIMAILEDDENNLWISSSKGIAKFDYKTKKFDIYDIADGIVNDGFNKNAAFKDENSLMYFGTNSGLVYFNPKEIKTNQIKPDVVITNFTILNDKKWIKKDILISKYNVKDNIIELNHDENIFSIEFASLDYTKPENNRYQYKIEEIHSDWIDYGNQRKITITSLAAGKYTLKIRGSNNDGVFSNEGVSLKIIIKPAFVETNIFYILVLILVGGLFAWIYHYWVKMRTNVILEAKNEELEQANLKLLQSEQNLKDLNESKDKFFSIIAHDLRNPFSPLISLSEMLDSEYEILDEQERRDYIREIRYGAKRLYDLLENLLHWSLAQTKRIKFRPEILDLDDLVSINIDLLSINAEKKEIKLIKNFDGDYEVFADEDMLNLVVRNLLNNAIKFSHEKSEIIVNLDEMPEFYVIEIKDSGVGISPSDMENIFTGLPKDRKKKKGSGSGLGLILCKEFVEKNGGKIWVESKLNEGCSFFFSIQKA